jgi:hypothetical protein
MYTETFMAKTFLKKVADTTVLVLTFSSIINYRSQLFEIKAILWL